jgi:hypothetical protein
MFRAWRCGPCGRLRAARPATPPPRWTSRRAGGCHSCSTRATRTSPCAPPTAVCSPCAPHSDGKRLRIVTAGLSGGRSLTLPLRDASRFPSTRWYPVPRATPTRRESLGFVYRSRTISCRAVPNLNVTSRNILIAVPRASRTLFLLLLPRWVARLSAGSCAAERSRWRGVRARGCW